MDLYPYKGLPSSSEVKNLPAMQKTQEMQIQSLGWEDTPGEGHGHPLQYSLPGEPHGHRSLVGYSPWGCTESDMTELTTCMHSWVF